MVRAEEMLSGEINILLVSSPALMAAKARKAKSLALLTVLVSWLLRGRTCGLLFAAGVAGSF
jgi:hypothetical protein